MSLIELLTDELELRGTGYQLNIVKLLLLARAELLARQIEFHIVTIAIEFRSLVGSRSGLVLLHLRNFYKLISLLVALLLVGVVEEHHWAKGVLLTGCFGRFLRSLLLLDARSNFAIHHDLISRG